MPWYDTPFHLISCTSFIHRYVMLFTGHTWSLAIQFQFSLLLPVVYQWLHRSRTWIVFCVTGIGLSVIYRFIGYYSIVPVNNPSNFAPRSVSLLTLSSDPISTIYS
jgi:peptidoglycan/LPS O-acetylase OafA/YrhL